MQEFIGFDPSALAYNRSYTISDERPGMVRIDDALVAPFEPTIGGNFLEELSGGVFDAKGHLVGASTQPRSDGCNGVRLKQIASSSIAKVRLSRAVFGGFAFDHFGHFILEATARLWCLPEYSDLPWLFLTHGKPNLSSYQIGFLETLGLSRGQIVAVSELHHIGDLIVPSPSFIYHHYVTHAYRDTFRNAKISTDHSVRRRIFLSRGNTTIARTVGEHELEEILARDGWDIVIPEHLPPREQALLFRNPNTLMGLQGSAMHLGLFAPPGRRVVHLCRGAGYRGYYVLDDLMEADASYLVAMSEHRLASKPIRGPFMLDLDRTITFLRDRSLLSRSKAVAALPRANEINRLDLEYQAWWHYTEGQVRFHQQVDHEGGRVQQRDAQAPAMDALALLPDEPELLAFAVAMALKFDGTVAAATLLETYAARLTDTHAEADAPLLDFWSFIHDAHGDYEAAMEASARSIKLAPGNVSYVNQMAKVLFRMRRFDEALTLLQDSVQCGLATSASYFLMSVIHHERGDVAEKISFAEQALQMDWHDPSLCKHLANMLVDDGQQHRARDVFETFLSRNASPDPSCLTAAAVLETSMGNDIAALAHLLEAYRIDPDDAQIRGTYLEALTRAGLFPTLPELPLQVSPGLTAQSVLIYNRSLSLAENGDLMHALRVAVAAVEVNPANHTIVSNLLSLMIRLDRHHDARLLAGILIGKGVATGETFYVLSLIEGDLGRGDAAREAAGRAAEMAPENSTIADHYHRLLQEA